MEFPASGFSEVEQLQLEHVGNVMISGETGDLQVGKTSKSENGLD